MLQTCKVLKSMAREESKYVKAIGKVGSLSFLWLELVLPIRCTQSPHRLFWGSGSFSCSALGFFSFLCNPFWHSIWSSNLSDNLCASALFTLDLPLFFPGTAGPGSTASFASPWPAGILLSSKSWSIFSPWACPPWDIAFQLRCCPIFCDGLYGWTIGVAIFSGLSVLMLLFEWISFVRFKRSWDIRVRRGDERIGLYTQRLSISIVTELSWNMQRSNA